MNYKQYVNYSTDTAVKADDSKNKWMNYLEFAALTYTKDPDTARSIAKETYDMIHEEADLYDKDEQRLIYASAVSREAIKYLQQEILNDKKNWMRS